VPDLNGVMFQAFHYFLPWDPSHPLWDFLATEADHLRDIGVDAVWIPPPCKCQGGTWSVGYDVFDQFDQCKTIPTRYGSKGRLHAAINALHGYGLQGQKLVPLGKRYLQVYVDIVINQKFGGDEEATGWDAIRVDPADRTSERWGPGYECGQIHVVPWTDFRTTARGNTYSSFRWAARHFSAVDSVKQIEQDGRVFRDPEMKYVCRFLYNEAGWEPHEKTFSSWVSHEKGNFDFLCGADVDFSRHDVREEMKHWGAWLTRTIGADGFRLDAAKHYDAGYAREWLGHVRAQAGANLFCVGEYLSGAVGDLHGYLTEVTAAGSFPQDVSLFDFPLRFQFRDASWNGETFDLRGLVQGR
jgi:alpha-amylase